MSDCNYNIFKNKTIMIHMKMELWAKEMAGKKRVTIY